MDRGQPIHIFINKQKFDLSDAVQTGASLKNLAVISLGDVLFLQRQGDDEVIANDAQITLKNGDHLHSQPAADYGSGAVELGTLGLFSDRAVLYPQPDGWQFLVISEYKLPRGFRPDVVELLIKLPPTFPDAAPDMFWVAPEVKTPGGTVPRATSVEHLLGKPWQRFSWHLASGAWVPGVSELSDYLRCVAARFLRLD